MQDPAIILAHAATYAIMTLPDGRTMRHKATAPLADTARREAASTVSIYLPDAVLPAQLPDLDPSLPPYHVLAARNKRGRTAWQTIPAAALDGYPHALRWPTVRSAAPSAILDVADAAGWRVVWDAAP